MLQDFWRWKRAQVFRAFCKGEYHWNEFAILWENIRTKVDEMPERDTPLYKELYEWNGEMPLRYEPNYNNPAGQPLRQYYEEFIIPIRKAKDLSY